ncbi:MAG: riboflavin biosynthesis protein RibF [Oscillospiraceae bacterium]|nr:riboflavin biosynthesis protein RibF [Oscillospiraceae bacterium]
MAEVKRAIALGFFDGVHIGHAALLNKAKQRAAAIGATPSVLSFDTHPDTLVFGRELPLINSAAGREELIRRLFGIEDVLFIHFDEHTMRMPWQDFAASVIRELGADWVVVGQDFRFGYRGEGTAEKLRDFCAARGVGCDVIEPVRLDGRVVSSSYIRMLIADGDMEQAARFLGHVHGLTDTVRSGYHLGSKLGAPTINMRFPEGVIVPRHGVYAARVYLENGEDHVAVTNVGVRPTVSEGKAVSVESHLLDYAGNLYGRQARVAFYKLLREERRFDSVEELSAQIARDAAQARAYFAAAETGKES